MKQQNIPDDERRTMPGSVLVVEDDAILSLSIEQALREAGVERVECCGSTESALAALKREQPDAIVLDVHLADRDDGWAIAELVRSLGPASPRIVFSTGMPKDIPLDIGELGCILEKPYPPEALIELLQQPERRGIIARLRGALR